MKAALTALAFVCAGQASALSCMIPDPRGTFLNLMEVEQPYYILLGQVQFDTDLLPGVVLDGVPDPDPINARFTGKGLTSSGFDARFERDVILQPICFGPWCGGAPAGVETLFFAKVTGDVITIEADPCGTTVFPEPLPEMLDAMSSCINGGPCEAPDDL